MGRFIDTCMCIYDKNYIHLEYVHGNIYICGIDIVVGATIQFILCIAAVLCYGSYEREPDAEHREKIELGRKVDKEHGPHK